MASTDLTFGSRDEHRAWLAYQAPLPRGFRVGISRFEFMPFELPKPARMTLTLIALDRPTPSFAAVFTRNAFPGAPVVLGRRRLAQPALGAVIVNNRISNVCAPGGIEAAERVCAEVGRALGIGAGEVLPSSTGVIGWRLPVDAMAQALPAAVANLQARTILPAAEGIMTTDLYPKVRRVAVGGGSVVGIAKGAGMIEPNLGTMLAYILTDLAVPRDFLRAALARAVDATFNAISIDSDTSTSDSVVALSSGIVPAPDHVAFEAALRSVAGDLAEDVVRNGEGVHHVVRLALQGAPDTAAAREVGKAVINSPLFQCAVCGNDPNVGRLIAALGKQLGARHAGLDVGCTTIAIAGRTIFAEGAFRLNATTEALLIEHLRHAEMYASRPPADGLTFKPPHDYPPHERCVEIAIDLGAGDGACTVVGADRSHEYISENADYRS